MKRIICVILFYALLLTGCNQGKKDPHETVSRLKWLTGNWAMKTGDGTITEQWKPVNDSLMEGSSDFIKGDSVIPFEKIRLFRRNNTFYYEATAAGKNDERPVEFKLTLFSDTGFVAENPAHDFPKRIVYKLKSISSLYAYIDDGTETGEKQIFYYKRQ